MLVKYKTVVKDSEDGVGYTSAVLLQGECVPCCERMKKASAGGVFELGDNSCGPTKPVFSVVHNYVRWGDSETDYYPIDFCPFCGKKVELVEAKRVREVRKTKDVTWQQVVIEEVPIE